MEMKKILAMVLAVMMLVSFAACGGDKDNKDTVDIFAKSEGVMTYAEYAAAAQDSTVTVEGFVQAKRSWWDNKVTFFMQDGDGAYFVYEAACAEADYDKLKAGVKVKVTGSKAVWNGEIEIMQGTWELVGSDTYVAEAEDVTALLANTDELIKKQNKFVSFKGMTVEATKDADGNDVAYLYNWDGSGEEGSDLYFKVSVNGATYTFTIESYLTDANSDVYKAVKALKVGDKIDMEGFLYWYEGPQPHITSVAAAK